MFSIRPATNTQYARCFARLLVALPVFSLSLGALAWLRYGIDLPWYDDWRAYNEGTLGSLKLRYLFGPLNDTLAPVGLALDSLAQRFLDGNSVAYQLLTMLSLLGLLLVLQWKLLHKTLGNTLETAVCFSFTVLMLQPGSYWGLENLAFHQCLPLVFILGALCLLAASDHPGAWRGPAAGLLALLAGFSYISGAFGALAAGISLLAVAWFCFEGRARRELLRDGAWFTGGAAFATGCQLYFSVLKFRGTGTHAGIPLALPSEPPFWMFALGKVARSLVLPAGRPVLSLTIAVAVCCVATAAAVAVVLRARASEATPADRRLAAVYVPLAAMVFVYLMLVAAGRTNFRAPELTRLLDIFVFGFTRFHFFWLTLLWPWLAAVLIVIARRRFAPGSAAAGWVAGIGALLLAALMLENGAYSHMKKQQQLAAERADAARCLLEELQKGAEVRCAGLIPPRFEDKVPDAYPGYWRARQRGASFVRSFPLLPDTKRRDSIAPFYRLQADANSASTHGMQAVGPNAYRALAGGAQLLLDVGNASVMRQCAVVDIELELKVSAADSAQVFYRPVGVAEFSAKYSSSLPVKANDHGFELLTFRLQSDAGFETALRLVPVKHPQALEIGDVRLYCLHRRP